MLELLILALFYGMLCAGVAAYLLLFWHAIVAPDHKVPAAPLITLLLALLLIFVAQVDPPLPRDGFLSRLGAALIVAWLGWALWSRT
jgi:hypothetical protein